MVGVLDLFINISLSREREVSSLGYNLMIETNINLHMSIAEIK